MGEKIIRAMSPGKLGGGFLQSALDKAMAYKPDFIGCDAGSTDPGPYYMGSGEAYYSDYNIKRDMRALLLAARGANIPLIVGSVVATGTNNLLEKGVRLLKEIVAEEKLSGFKLAVIHAEQDKEVIKAKMKMQTIHPLGAFADLTEKDVDDAVVINGQMGVEPIIKALEMGADVIFCGRCCDDAIFAAYPVWKGFDQGLALHVGKILECGSMSCIPNDLHGSLVAHLAEDHFILEPPEEFRKSTYSSVAAHTLYEREDPLWQPGPGGANDLSGCVFEQVTDRTVKVSGSKWVKADQYTVRLEGASFAGYRCIAIGGVRDPIMIGIMDDILDHVREEIKDRFGEPGEKYNLIFRQYGKNAVLGELEPNKDFVPNELGILIEVVAETEEMAFSVCSSARGCIQHAYYPGIIATAGNFANPYSPFAVPAGKVFQFNIDHLIVVDDPCELFPIDIIEF